MLTFRILSLTTVLASLALVSTAIASPSFQARITIRSECSIQQPLFGPSAQGAATVICHPGATPFQSYTAYLGNADERLSSAGPLDIALDGDLSDLLGPSGFPLLQKERLPIPRSRTLTPYSTIIYVVF